MNTFILRYVRVLYVSKCKEFFYENAMGGLKKLEASDNTIFWHVNYIVYYVTNLVLHNIPILFIKISLMTLKPRW